jgi:glycosyltransferase involved in cell wall biosynthesis
MPGAETGGFPGVSVVIPMYNAETTLRVQLEALVTQEGAPPFEVVVADNGSTDGGVWVAESFRDRLKLRVVDASRVRGPSHARNVGVEAAQGGKILFCDADDRVGPGWVRALAAALERDAIVTGPIVYVDAADGGVPSGVRIPTEPRKYLGQIPFAMTANLGIRRQLFEELGGFDGTLLSGEDADLCIRALLAGHRLGWVPEAPLRMTRRSSLLQAARQFFRYGLFDVRVYAKHRATALERRPLREWLRPYLVLAATPHRLLTRRRWSWVIQASQRAGRLVGSVQAGVFCP